MADRVAVIPARGGSKGVPGKNKRIVGGKPLFSPMFAFPISYELTILFTAFATIIGMFVVNGLPMHYHPVLKYEHIRRGMDDTFFIVIESLGRSLYEMGAPPGTS